MLFCKVHFSKSRAKVRKLIYMRKREREKSTQNVNFYTKHPKMVYGVWCMV